MTPRQLQIIHATIRKLGIDDADYRTILRSIGHVDAEAAIAIEKAVRAAVEKAMRLCPRCQGMPIDSIMRCEMCLALLNA